MLVRPVRLCSASTDHKINVCDSMSHGASAIDYFDMESARFLRSQFDLPKSDEFLQVSVGEIFQIHGRNEVSGHLDAQDVSTGRYGSLPRTSEAFYVDVIHSNVPFHQPLVLLGSLAGHVKDLLLERNSELFATAVPHTTRPRRATEKNGVHYWFVRRTTMEQMINNNLFVECVDISGNLYGTSEAAVRTVAQKQVILSRAWHFKRRAMEDGLNHFDEKHCILSTTSVLRRLISKGLLPIVLFVTAETWQRLFDVICFDGATEETARREFEADDKIFEAAKPYLNGVVRNSLEDSYQKVLEILEKNRRNTWIPVVKPCGPQQRLI